MPDDSMWSNFFSPEQTLDALGMLATCGDVVDFGCGYGTFAIPAAGLVQGTVHALDIDGEMIRITAEKAAQAGLHNVRAEQRDFVARGTGLADGSVDYAMLFNLLHCEEPLALLQEAYRVLRSGGRLGVMHWNHDAATPRGPSMNIRPRPEQCRTWAEQAGFRAASDTIDLPPYHFGLLLTKAKDE